MDTVICIKKAGCPACIQFQPMWTKLKKDLSKKYKFMEIEYGKYIPPSINEYIYFFPMVLYVKHSDAVKYLEKNINIDKGTVPAFIFRATKTSGGYKINMEKEVSYANLIDFFECCARTKINDRNFCV